MRHAAAAIATRETTAVDDRYAPDGYTPDGEPALPALMKRWPDLRERGIEWTEVAPPGTYSAIRVIRVARPGAP